MTSGSEWWRDATCTSVGSEAFYPESDKATDMIRAAKALCMGCPVRQECLDHALASGEDWGIWGGLTTRERRRLVPRRGLRILGRPYAPAV